MPLFRVAQDVLLGGVGFSQPAVPDDGARADVEDGGHGGQFGGIPPGDLGAVVPLQGDRPGGQFLEQFPVFPDDVSPEHGDLPQVLHGGHDFLQEAHVEFLHVGGLLHQAAVLALPQVEGLVAADVAVPGMEKGQILLQDFRDQLEGAGVGGVEGVVGHAVVEGEGALGPLHLQFVQILQAMAAQGGVEMPEGGNGGNQFHMAGLAILLQPEDLLGGEGIPALPDVTVARQGKGVLHIQLEVVHLVVRHLVHQLEEGLQGGNRTAGDVMVEATHRVVGLVVQAEGRILHRGLGKNLAQGLQSVEEPRLPRGLQPDARRIPLQTVSIRGFLTLAQGEENARTPVGGLPDPQTKTAPRGRLQLPHKVQGGVQQGRGVVGGKTEVLQGVPADGLVGGEGGLPGGGNEVHGG